MANIASEHFPWVGVTYMLHVDYGISPLQWLNGLANQFLDLRELVFAADGSFADSRGSRIFPIGGVELMWCFDYRTEKILIHFYSDGERQDSWRWDELGLGAPTMVNGATAPELLGTGHVGYFTFTYLMQPVWNGPEGSDRLNKQSGNLSCVDGPSIHEEARLLELERRLVAEPVIPVIEQHHETTRQRNLRFLCSENFHVSNAERRIREHAEWWSEFGMDDFSEADEFDEEGPLFTCGEDLTGCPTLIARPCVHRAETREDSILAVRRSVYTLQRCIDRLPLGRETIIMIYDVAGVQVWNLDMTFTKELLHILDNYFPGRLGQIFVINMDWWMASLKAVITPLLDASASDRIVFCSEDFNATLLQHLPENHAYLCYARDSRRLPLDEAQTLPLPRASHAAKCRVAVGELDSGSCFNPVLESKNSARSGTNCFSFCCNFSSCSSSFAIAWVRSASTLSKNAQQVQQNSERPG